VATSKDGNIRLSELVHALNLFVACGEELLGQPVTGGYAGDLMSDVIAHGRAGNVWVTMQVHVTMVAVAVQKKLAAVILSQGRKPSKEALQRAKENKIVLLVSGQSTFETVAQLARLGLTGSNRE
jgi:hypothetical protein